MLYYGNSISTKILQLNFIVYMNYEQLRILSFCRSVCMQIKSLAMIFIVLH